MDIERITAHYNIDADLTGSILAAIKKEKGSLEGICADDLIPIDGFHIRGRKSTVELAKLLEVNPADRVLDLGSGSGGTARYLSTRFGCRVIGIDLTPAYVKLAAALSGLLGISDKTAFICGNVLELPFEDGSFDIVWTDHVQMNLPDKKRFAAELSRILKPGGKIAVHEVFTGDQGDPFLPAPWSSETATSFMVRAEEMETIFREMNLLIQQWQDVTEISNQWYQKMQARRNASGPSPLGIQLLMGPTATEKMANMGRSLAEGHARVILGIVQKP